MMLTWDSNGALGGTRTPNLLIRRVFRVSTSPAHMPFELADAVHRCAEGGNVEHCCAAKIRPARAGGR
jgi:hypothetical protein